MTTRGLTTAAWVERLLQAGPGLSVTRNNARRVGLYRADAHGVVIIEQRPAPKRVSKEKSPW